MSFDQLLREEYGGAIREALMSDSRIFGRFTDEAQVPTVNLWEIEVREELARREAQEAAARQQRHTMSIQTRDLVDPRAPNLTTIMRRIEEHAIECERRWGSRPRILMTPADYNGLMSAMSSLERARFTAQDHRSADTLLMGMRVTADPHVQEGVMLLVCDEPRAPRHPFANHVERMSRRFEEQIRRAADQLLYNQAVFGDASVRVPDPSIRVRPYTDPDAPIDYSKNPVKDRTFLAECERIERMPRPGAPNPEPSNEEIAREAGSRMVDSMRYVSSGRAIQPEPIHMTFDENGEWNGPVTSSDP